MNIRQGFRRIKAYEKDALILSSFILTAVIGFGLGRISLLEEKRPAVRIEEPATASSTSTPVTGGGEKLYVASKTGTKYHYPWCAGASQIKEENKLWFGSPAEARAAGYAPASNCKGLE